MHDRMDPRAFRRRAVACVRVIAMTSALIGCGGARENVTPAEPHRPRRPPASQLAREHALREFAERAFRVVQTRAPVTLIFDESGLARLLNPVAAGRATLLRGAMTPDSGVPPVPFEALRGSRFSGACFQGLREEPAGTVMGLMEPGWVFERVLLVGQEATGRIATWLEGEFLWTDAGFGALSVLSVEDPRRGHADLELAVCDVDLGVHRPLDVVVSDPFNH
jgi:hypothetical protein